ncbi:MAG: hypothetical protein JNJ47_04715 [Alphaproteobacteria bacterium]|nr:hypothetical protein [Alphaproteobacteria bacterium]
MLEEYCSVETIHLHLERDSYFWGLTQLLNVKEYLFGGFKRFILSLFLSGLLRYARNDEKFNKKNVIARSFSPKQSIS